MWTVSLSPQVLCSLERVRGWGVPTLTPIFYHPSYKPWCSWVALPSTKQAPTAGKSPGRDAERPDTADLHGDCPLRGWMECVWGAYLTLLLPRDKADTWILDDSLT